MIRSLSFERGAEALSAPRTGFAGLVARIAPPSSRRRHDSGRRRRRISRKTSRAFGANVAKTRSARSTRSLVSRRVSASAAGSTKSVAIRPDIGVELERPGCASHRGARPPARETPPGRWRGRGAASASGGRPAAARRGGSTPLARCPARDRCARREPGARRRSGGHAARSAHSTRAVSPREGARAEGPLVRQRERGGALTGTRGPRRQEAAPVGAAGGGHHGACTVPARVASTGRGCIGCRAGNGAGDERTYRGTSTDNAVPSALPFPTGRGAPCRAYWREVSLRARGLRAFTAPTERPRAARGLGEPRRCPQASRRRSRPSSGPRPRRARRGRTPAGTWANRTTS